MTRKNFLQTVAGTAASASMAPSLGAAPVTKAKFKLGCCMYCYQAELKSGLMSLEDCIADVADMGGEGIQIQSQSLVPNYPDPPASWVKQWFGWMEKYHTTPSNAGIYIDTMLHKDRLLTTQECVDSLTRDFRVASRLGFKSVRTQVVQRDDVGMIPPLLTPEIAERALPFAEKYNVKLGIELHSPCILVSEEVDVWLDFISRTKTKWFGFVPDFGIFGKGLLPSQMDGLLKQGARRNVIEYIVEGWRNNLGTKKIVAEVEKMGGNETEKKYASNTHHMVMNPPRDILRVLPYTVNIHGKFSGMLDDATCPALNYEGVIPVLIEGGYSGSIDSEYEGQRTEFQARAQVRLHHVMIRRLAGMA